jgi:hypothetical protein
MLVQRPAVRHLQLHAMGGRDQEAALLQAADVFLALQHEVDLAAVGLDTPGAGRGEGVDRDQALERRVELASGQLGLEQAARALRQVRQARNPGQLVAVRADEGHAFVRRRDGMGTHRRDGDVGIAVQVGQHEAAVGIQAQVAKR